jgi:hypothetical protein
MRAFVQKSKSVLNTCGSFSEQNAKGVQASVYNVNAKNWTAPSESVETIEQGKLKAAIYAEAYLEQADNLDLPSLK